ncbi:hypothetical protein EAO73_14205 [Streptomyces sp. col6]|nr:hypothetical protein EAO73_14205 [Streptomyces sp. col6]
MQEVYVRTGGAGAARAGIQSPAPGPEGPVRDRSGSRSHGLLLREPVPAGGRGPGGRARSSSQ